MQKEFCFQPFSASFTRDPYAIYALMREQCPLYYHQPWNMYLLSRYEDIACLVNDPRLLRTLDHLLSTEELAAKREAENWAATPAFSRYVRVNILDSEAEMHARLRRLVFRAFTPARINSLRECVQQQVDNILDTVKHRGEMDFIEDFITPVPGFIIGKIIGVAEADRPRLRGWSEDIVQFFEPDRSEAEIQRAEKASLEFSTYLLELLAEREAKAEDDLISELLIAEKDGALSRDELISTCMIILMAGHGSTIDVSGNGMLALLRHPRQMQKLQAEPGLIHSAVQEMFRYDSPLPFFHRILLEDMHYKDRFFGRGTRFGILYGSANRDPAQFSEADSFDIARQPNRHLAFGIGTHFCLGNHLARLNMEIMFTTLLRELPALELAEAEVAYRPGLSSRGLQRLRLKWQC